MRLNFFIVVKCDLLGFKNLIVAILILSANI
jgi:hypothetical protein